MSIYQVSENLKEALNSLAVNDLRILLRILPPTGAKAARKGDLIRLILQHYLDSTKLRKLIKLLDETQKLALIETVHSRDGEFDPDSFKAKYGKNPN